MSSGQPVNKTEAFVLSLCQRTTLSLWSYNNPIAEPGKELCDVLIVCEPHIIIISVKEIILGADGSQVDHERWERKAVDASVRQIYGAEKSLTKTSQVIRSDGSPGHTLPPMATRKVHRIAVAFGGRGEVAIKSGDFGKGFVHVMTEESFDQVLTELDTINDLVEYLGAKEQLLTTTSVLIEGGEGNLLGLYLHGGRKFPTGHDLITVDNTIWAGLQQNTDYVRRKEAEKESYVWDRLIDLLADPKAKSVSGPPTNLSDLELALRSMARERRLARRLLGPSVREFVELGKAKRVRSRAAVGDQGTIYVLVYFQPNDSPERRMQELFLRCRVARHQAKKGNAVVGIGLSDYSPREGSMSDLIYMDVSQWMPEDDAAATKMMAELGYFSKACGRHVHVDEYPATTV